MAVTREPAALRIARRYGHMYGGVLGAIVALFTIPMLPSVLVVVVGFTLFPLLLWHITMMMMVIESLKAELGEPVTDGYTAVSDTRVGRWAHAHPRLAPVPTYLLEFGSVVLAIAASF